MPIQARRTALPRIPRDGHAGLVYQRGLETAFSGGENPRREELLQTLSSYTSPNFYHLVYQRLKVELAALGAVVREFDVTDRLSVGLGGESPFEVGLTLHHTYGTPIIPGDSLKGLTRHYFAQNCTLGEADIVVYNEALFGSPLMASGIDYLGAWYIPGSAPDDQPLVRDVLTVHHQKYYTGTTGDWPTDFDDPNPVTYLSVRGSFLVAVNGPSEEWSEFAFDTLEAALRDAGAGGKTSSGKGRMTRSVPEAHKQRYRLSWRSPQATTPGVKTEPSGSPTPTKSALLIRLEVLTPLNVPPQITPIAQEWLRLPDGPEREAVGLALKATLIRAKLWTNSKWRAKPWVITLTEEFGET